MIVIVGSPRRRIQEDMYRVFLRIPVVFMCYNNILKSMYDFCSSIYVLGMVRVVLQEKELGRRFCLHSISGVGREERGGGVMYIY